MYSFIRDRDSYRESVWPTEVRFTVQDSVIVGLVRDYCYKTGYFALKTDSRCNCILCIVVNNISRGKGATPMHVKKTYHIYVVAFRRKPFYEITTGGNTLSMHKHDMCMLTIDVWVWTLNAVVYISLRYALGSRIREPPDF